MSENIEKFPWSPLAASSASELTIGSRLTNSSGVVIKKIADNIWQYTAKSGNLSYNDNSIDALKSIDSIFFDVELYT